MSLFKNGRVGLILVAIAMVTINIGGPAVADENVEWGPGHHFGLEIRITTGGTWNLSYDFDNWEGGRETQNEFGGLATSPGFSAYWEYITNGGNIGIGLGFGCHFHSANYWLSQFAIGTEIQIGPRIRLYLTDTGWMRPYIQAAAGFSFGASNSMTADKEHGFGVPSAIAINTSVGIGALFIPEGSPVSLFSQIGIEATFFWADQKYEYQEETRKLSGSIRHLLLVFGLAY